MKPQSKTSLHTPTLTLHYQVDSYGAIASDETYQVTQASNIARLIINSPNQSHNVLDQQSIADMAAVLDALEADDSVTGLLITSAKHGCFIAGADIQMLDQCSHYQQAFALAQQGQALFQRLTELPFPVIAAIDGVCLGGGFELALACGTRIASDLAHTKIGLPEVQLGLLPGSGGTQRLPHLIGCAAALQVIMTGKQYRAQQALRMGMVDEVVPAMALLPRAMQHFSQQTKQTKQSKQNKRAKPSFWQNNLVSKAIIFRQAQAKGLKQSQGHYPALPAIITACRQAYQRGAGYAVEAEQFAQLVMSPESQALRRLFFAQTELKQAGKEKTGHVQQVLVLGGGLMGAGIGLVSVNRGDWDVKIKDLSTDAVAKALAYSYRYFKQKRRRGFISQGELDQKVAKLSGAVSFSHLGNINVVFEAIYEDLATKQAALKQVAPLLAKGAIFASNTSSIPIADIATASEFPSQVIGIHYFSPVEKMPLVEVIPHPGTSEQTLQQALAIAQQQGKTAIVVKDSAGFYVNRVLAPYINEAMRLMLAGEPILKVDKALQRFGFPVGPFKLLDEVGLDIAAHIAPVLQQHLGERFTPPEAIALLLDNGRLGKKAQLGFYLYQGRDPGKQVDARVMAELKVKLVNQVSESDIAWRCVIMLLLEVLRCLDEGIVNSDKAADIGAVFGIGFPAYWGGPINMARTLGIEAVSEKCAYLSQTYGERFILSSRLKQVLQDLMDTKG